jgi:hypothetical protein
MLPDPRCLLLVIGRQAVSFETLPIYPIGRCLSLETLEECRPDTCNIIFAGRKLVAVLKIMLVVAARNDRVALYVYSGYCPQSDYYQRIQRALNPVGRT